MTADLTCRDPHTLRWHCMRGYSVEDKPAKPGICPLLACERLGANRPSEGGSE